LIGARFGHFLDRPLRPLLRRIKINPNLLTVTGFLITAAASCVIAFNLRAGGALMLFGGLFDMIDGMVARTQGKETAFGAFLDSSLDRYSDAMMFLGLSWYMGSKGDHAAVYLSLGTMIGAFLISYVRAKAEALGIECETGIMERPERVMLLSFGALTGWMLPVLYIMFTLTHLTVFQRFFHVFRQLRRDTLNKSK
jgi:phosphatidylglycerophosphate synthase